MGAIMLRWVVSSLLAWLNGRFVTRHLGQVPSGLRGFVDEETYRKAGAYTLAKIRFGLVEGVWETGILVAVLVSGVLPAAWETWAGSFGSGSWSGALFLVVAFMVLALPDLPWQWWAQFRLEARFGFNRSTLGLWISDLIKGAIVGLVIGFPVVWLLLVIVEHGGQQWWIWGWAAFMVIQLVLVVVYPWFIQPLFNKFTPLSDDSLRDRLMAVAERGRFAAKTILVMDGSRRSGHSNAFFTGFGRFRRIVLYDTLVTQLTPEELEAVLAHEIGHYRLGHIWKGILLASVMTFGGFALIGWLMRSEAFFAAFGFAAPENAIAFLLFGMLGGVFGFWLSPLTNLLSRRHEYEADAFARGLVGGAEPMVGALGKLTRENLSNFTPHPVFSAFHYSHPTLLERVDALREPAAQAA